MEKLKKLSISKMNEFPVIDGREQMELKGGNDGAAEYQARYGTSLDDGCIYNPITNSVSSGCSSPGSGSTYYIVETCGVCDMETYGQHGGGNFGPQSLLEAWWAVEHYFGRHDNCISRDTIYYGQ